MWHLLECPSRKALGFQNPCIHDPRKDPSHHVHQETAEGPGDVRVGATRGGTSSGQGARLRLRLTGPRALASALGRAGVADDPPPFR